MPAGATLVKDHRLSFDIGGTFTDLVLLDGENGDAARRQGPHRAELTARHLLACPLANSGFFRLYRALATSWRVYDNSGTSVPRLVAAGRGDVVTRISDREAWERLQAKAR